MSFYSIIPYSTISICPSGPLGPKAPWKIVEDKAKIACRNKKVKKDMARNHKDCCNHGKDSQGRTLQDYFIPIIEVIYNIYYLPMETSSFKMKLALINMMQNMGQFRGLPTEEPWST
ncbi:hypothetical protein CR513_56199, partial [Mucuna pruriens]